MVLHLSPVPDRQRPREEARGEMKLATIRKPAGETAPAVIFANGAYDIGEAARRARAEGFHSLQSII
jgi:hypothetical protein